VPGRNTPRNRAKAAKGKRADRGRKIRRILRNSNLPSPAASPSRHSSQQSKTGRRAAKDLRKSSAAAIFRRRECPPPPNRRKHTLLAVRGVARLTSESFAAPSETCSSRISCRAIGLLGAVRSRRPWLFTVSGPAARQKHAPDPAGYHRLIGIQIIDQFIAFGDIRSLS
jgi:hypothetical protein